jgi:hypothetical protein
MLTILIALVLVAVVVGLALAYERGRRDVIIQRRMLGR